MKNNKAENLITSIAVVGAISGLGRGGQEIGASKATISGQTRNHTPEGIVSIYDPQEEYLREQSIDEGFLTVYAPGVWEEEIYNRTGYVFPGYTYADQSPLLNPEIASDPELMRLIREKNIIAINPAMISKDYMELMDSLVGEGKQNGADDNELRNIIMEHDREFTDYAYRDALGKVLEIAGWDGRSTEVVVMSVFSSVHAAEDLSLIPARNVKTTQFVGDVHNNFMEKNFGLSFDYEKGWWVDSNGNAISSGLPWIYLLPKSRTDSVSQLLQDQLGWTHWE